MKKKFLKLFATLFACATLALGFAACEGKHEHAYTAVVTAPTCTEQGFTTHTCTCGDSYIADYVNPLDHEFIHYVSDGNAKCGVDGTETATCNREGCNVTDTRTDEDSALDHDLKTHEGKTPTCTEIGWKEYVTCEREGCDYSTYEELPATAHPTDSNWTCNESHHWHNTTCDCNLKVDYSEHSLDSDGFCPTCKQPITATAGVLYDVSADGTYAEVIAYTGTAKNVKIADTYKNLPVTNIYDSAFENATIASIVIPDSVTSIGYRAFYNCNSLTSVVIPDSVTSIGYEAFYNYSSLTSVYITDIKAWCNISFSGYSANPLNYANNLYLNNELVTELVIPNTVTKIEAYAFYNCDSLTSVVIPNSVTSIGYQAFAGCSSLTSVVIGDSVTSIGDEAFSGCDCLTNVVIGDSVTSIGYEAFRYCDSLQYNTYENAKYLGNNNNPYLVLTGVTNTNFSTYTIHEKTKLIAINAFAGCNRLTSIAIPDSVTSIDNDAFLGCSSLTSIEIPNSVTSIAKGVFAYCNSLTEITLPFVGESKDGTSNNYFSYIFTNDFYSIIPTSLKKVTITGGNIGDRAFQYCSSLTSVVIGDSVTSIGHDAFYNCSSLTSVYYTGTASDWAKISIGSSNGCLTNAKRYYYTESEPTLNSSGTAYDGNYWHYVDGVATPWVYTAKEE